jgi:N-acylneuraminate cytidylyltransferase
MILGITPARGGSKSVPRKNIKEICGKPLIAWTIEAALKSELLDRYIISTEDSEIADISRAFGAEVLDRPPYLATDDATTLSVLQHALGEIDADIVVLLQCTSPVRRPGLIDECIRAFRRERSDSLATGYMCSLFEWGTYSARRQELRPFFHDDGNVYVIDADLIRSGDMLGSRRSFFYSKKNEIFEIDDDFDFWLNEQILIHYKKFP